MSFVSLDGYVVSAETRLAIGVVKVNRTLEDVASGSDIVWIPRSLCDDGAVLEKGDKDISVREWFCEKEGLDH